MSAVPLRLGPMTVAGHVVVRSALRWLCPDGHVARAGEPIAYCNIGVVAGNGGSPFADEARDLQVAFAPVAGGTVRRADAGGGGFLDRLNSYRWSADHVFAHLSPSGPPADATTGDPAVPRLLMVAGRRMTEIAEERSGLLTGWHDRVRGWWGDGPTLLALGTCELGGALRGDRSGFVELFEAAPGFGQIVVGQDEPLVPAARILIEQLERTPAAMAEIAADTARAIATAPVVAQAADWLFVGALLAGLARTPIVEGHVTLGRTGLMPRGPAAAVMLSLTAELPPLLRHRRLGYTIACHPFRLTQTGAATRTWLADHFVPLPRGLEDVAADYRRLSGLMAARTGARLLVLNGISTQAYEDILHYSAFDPPLGETLSTVRMKERNVMLDELAAAGVLRVIDMDRIVAEQGMWAHLPDGIHQSGAVQAALRDEIVMAMADAVGVA